MGADAFAFRPILGQSAHCRGSRRRPAIPRGPPPVLRSGRSTPPTGGQRCLCRPSGGRADALPGRCRSSKADASAGSQHGRGRSCRLDTFFDPLGRGPWAKANRIRSAAGEKVSPVAHRGPPRSWAAARAASCRIANYAVSKNAVGNWASDVVTAFGVAPRPLEWTRMPRGEDTATERRSTTSNWGRPDFDDTTVPAEPSAGANLVSGSTCTIAQKSFAA